MNKAILNTDVQDFISANLNTETHSVSLAKSPFASVSSKELAEQIDGKKRCEHKLSLWFQTGGIYYPQKLAIEQSSSEIAARYKSNLIRGDEIIDLTGGFGVDTFFFALTAKHVTHCELSRELSDISSYNSEILGVKINYMNTDGLEFIKSSDKKFSTIYIDPSRRINSKKVFLLKDCEPDIIGNMKPLLEHSPFLMIKAAPMLDIHLAINELKQVSEVHIISIKNECKELLWLVDSAYVDMEPLIICATINEGETAKYSFRYSEEKAYQIPEYSRPVNFIYEPDVALLKAGCFKLITRDFNLKKISQHTHLYTSDMLNNSFLGRKFKLTQSWNYGSFIKENTFRKANIICRNFPLSPEKLKKKLKINDGGEEYLLFCRGSNDELLVLHCVRL